MAKIKIGLIGAGNMGQAIIQGLAADNCYEISIYEKDVSRANLISRKYKARKKKLEQLTNDCNLIIICVKPQIIDSVLDLIKNQLKPDQLIISIAAGINTRHIEQRLGKNIPVIRVMPNMPALIGQGISGFCLGKYARTMHVKQVIRIFSAVGTTIAIDEKQMDAFTAVAGSGPGFIAYITDCLISAAIKAGLDKKTAKSLCVQTLQGTINLIAQTGIEPKELAEKVASKGGTTEAGLKVLKTKQTAAIIQQTIKAAAKRAKELSR
ncbi:MAG: pyrroline-5-carboxylate reductase [Candidatus Omnitrophica bacterium]|nr:pyrroline-5-carboxylate reductase [Candidatus Omnitrophota bacterium]